MTLFKALDIPIKLEHRGAVSDGRTGDGAGILLISLMIFLKVCDFEPQNKRVLWNGFLPKKENQAEFCAIPLKLYAIKI
jgi:glutamate synthase domain-containing protein 1